MKSTKSEEYRSVPRVGVGATGDHEAGNGGDGTRVGNAGTLPGGSAAPGVSVPTKGEGGAARSGAAPRFREKRSGPETGEGANGTLRPTFRKVGEALARVGLGAAELRLLLRALLPYAAFGVLWLSFADPAARRLLDAYSYDVFQSYKGWLFVAISLFLIYLLVRGEQVARVRSEEKFSAAFATTPDPMVLVRRVDGTVVEVNRGFEERLGYRKSEVAGRTLSQVGVWAQPADADRLARSLRERDEVRDLETELRARDERLVSVLVSGRRVRIGRKDYSVLLAKDITESKAYQARVEHQSLHDPLTGLPNRSLLLDRIRQQVARSGRSGTRVAVVSLNLDRFSVVNDSLGHAAGDRVLVEVGRRIMGCLRSVDTVARSPETVGRVGADEFTVVLGGIRQTEDAELVARRIQEAVEGPVEVEGRELRLRAAVGIAMSDVGGTPAEELFRRAGTALRRAKGRGLGRIRLFDASVDDSEARRLRLEGDLRGAVERNELSLRYQPIVELATGRIVSVETLARWEHPELGEISPLEFIPLAEESGLIFSVESWVLGRACRRAANWLRRFDHHPSLQVAVDISARELEEAGFHEIVAEVLDAAGLPPTALELEITESRLMQSLAGIHALRRLRVSLAIDDFGTGYSSLAYLSRLPVDTLKIDRSFIGEFTKSPDSEAIVRSVVALARTLEMRVVAEGVETEEQLAVLRELGCTHAQGFLFAKPMRPEAAEALLEENPRW